MVAPAVSFALTFLPEGVSGKRDRHSVRAEQLRHCAVGAAQHGHQGLDALATLSAALCSVEGDLSWAQVAHSLDVERRKPAASFAELAVCDHEKPYATATWNVRLSAPYSLSSEGVLSRAESAPRVRRA